MAWAELIRPIVYGLLMWAVTIYAFRRGDGEQRLAAVIVMANSYITPLLLSPLATRYRAVEVPVAELDAVMTALLFAIALKSRRFWPLWLTALSAMVVLSHFLPNLPGNLPFIYYNAAVLWSYPMWIVLAWAIRNNKAPSPQTVQA